MNEKFSRMEGGGKMSKKLVSINLNEELISALDELAKTVGMSRSAVVNLVMRGTIISETEEALFISRKC